ncbi:MAG: hypothetical protein ACLFTW_03340, partial [Chitinispirillaceae bacterium]
MHAVSFNVQRCRWLTSFDPEDGTYFSRLADQYRQGECSLRLGRTYATFGLQYYRTYLKSPSGRF